MAHNKSFQKPSVQALLPNADKDEANCISQSMSAPARDRIKCALHRRRQSSHDLYRLVRFCHVINDLSEKRDNKELSC
jgi:hypothetical protein